MKLLGSISNATIQYTGLSRLPYSIMDNINMIISMRLRGNLSVICKRNPSFVHSTNKMDFQYSRAFVTNVGMMNSTDAHATTVLCVRKQGEVVIMADGQMTMGSEVVKNNIRKVRRIGENVIGGFAGATTDAFTLFERLEQRLEEHPGQLTRAAVDLAKAWRTDRYLRRLNVCEIQMNCLKF